MGPHNAGDAERQLAADLAAGRQFLRGLDEGEFEFVG